MKPVIILPPDVMSTEDIEKLTGNDFCVVVAIDPSKVKFLDPIPAASDRSHIEQAAIQLSRRVLSGTIPNVQKPYMQDDIMKFFLDCLMKGTPLDPAPTIEEQERRIVLAARKDELEKIGREEVQEEYQRKKAERATARSAKTAAK